MKRNLTYLGGLAALFGLALAVSTYNVDTSEVLADLDDQTITINCAANSLTTFAPSIDIELTQTASAATAANPFTTSVTVTTASFGAADPGDGPDNLTGVNADSFGLANINEGAGVVYAGESAGMVRLVYDAPTLKLAGLTCQSSAFTKATLSADNTVVGSSMFTQLSNAGTNAASTWASSTSYDDGGMIIGATSALPTTITDPLQDDATAFGDGAIDGEIVFGNGSGRANAVYKIQHQINMVSIGTTDQVHTMEYTFTPS